MNLQLTKQMSISIYLPVPIGRNEGTPYENCAYFISILYLFFKLFFFAFFLYFQDYFKVIFLPIILKQKIVKK